MRERPGVEQAELRALTHQPQPGAPTLAFRCDERCIEILCGFLRSDPDHGVRAAAAEALIAYGRALPLLEELAASESSRRKRRRIEMTARRLRQAVGTA